MKFEREKTKQTKEREKEGEIEIKSNKSWKMHIQQTKLTTIII